MSISYFWERFLHCTVAWVEIKKYLYLYYHYDSFNYLLFWICLLQPGLFFLAIKVTHTRWKPLSLSLSVCVFSDPDNVCVLHVDLEDHTGVRPPRCWCQTTRDVKGRRITAEKSGEEKGREVRREALSETGEYNWKSAKQEVLNFGMSIWGQTQLFMLYINEQCCSPASLTTT